MPMPTPSVFGYPVITWIPLSSFLDNRSQYRREGTFETILRRLPLSQALELCATLNLLVANPQDLFFARGNEEVLSRLKLYDRSKRKIQRHLSRNAQCRVLTRVNLLALMRWVAWLSQESNADSVEQKDGFLIAAIMAGDRFIANHTHLRNMNTEPGDYNPARIQLAYQVSFWGSGRGDPVKALGRARRLYLTHGPLLQDSFRQAFEQHTGLTLESFLCFMTFLSGAFMTGGTNNARRRMGENVADSENPIYRVEDLAVRFTPAARMFFDRHITQWTLTPTEFQHEIQHASRNTLEHGYRFKDFVDKPCLRIAHEKFIAVDWDCLAQQLTAGPVFKAIPILGAQQAFSIFGKGIENYVQDLLEEHNQILASSGRHAYFARGPKTQSRKHNNEITDITLTYDDTVVCVEVKAVWLKDDDVFNTDPNTFWERIKSRYLEDVATGECKGIRQLAKSILSLIHQHARPADDRVYPSRMTTIFPVLVVYDPRVNPTLNAALAHLFAEELGSERASSEGYLQVREVNVANLTVISVDHVEIYTAWNRTRRFVDDLRQFNERHPLREIDFLEYLRRTRPRGSDSLTLGSDYEGIWNWAQDYLIQELRQRINRR